MKKEFYKREWRDWDRISELKRDDLLWEIWIERSNKLNYCLVGILIGLIIGWIL